MVNAMWLAVGGSGKCCYGFVNAERFQYVFVTTVKDNERVVGIGRVSLNAEDLIGVDAAGGSGAIGIFNGKGNIAVGRIGGISGVNGSVYLRNGIANGVEILFSAIETGVLKHSTGAGGGYVAELVRVEQYGSCGRLAVYSGLR